MRDPVSARRRQRWRNQITDGQPDKAIATSLAADPRGQAMAQPGHADQYLVHGHLSMGQKSCCRRGALSAKRLESLARFAARLPPFGPGDSKVSFEGTDSFLDIIQNHFHRRRSVAGICSEGNDVEQYYG
jgi:hypothetical protein